MSVMNPGYRNCTRGRRGCEDIGRVRDDDVLHSEAEEGKVAADEEARRGAIRRHGLIALILHCKGVTVANPRGRKVLVQGGRFLEVPLGVVVLVYAHVVAAHRKPRHRALPILLHQFVPQKEKIVLSSELHRT